MSRKGTALRLPLRFREAVADLLQVQPPPKGEKAKLSTRKRNTKKVSRKKKRRRSE